MDGIYLVVPYVARHRRAPHHDRDEQASLRKMSGLLVGSSEVGAGLRTDPQSWLSLS